MSSILDPGVTYIAGSFSTRTANAQDQHFSFTVQNYQYHAARASRPGKFRRRAEGDIPPVDPHQSYRYLAAFNTYTSGIALERVICMWSFHRGRWRGFEGECSTETRSFERGNRHIARRRTCFTRTDVRSGSRVQVIFRKTTFHGKQNCSSRSTAGTSKPEGGYDALASSIDGGLTGSHLYLIDACCGVGDIKSDRWNDRCRCTMNAVQGDGPFWTSYGT